MTASIRPTWSSKRCSQHVSETSAALALGQCVSSLDDPAQMTVRSQSARRPANRHVGADRCLFVRAGAELTRAAGRRRSLRKECLRLIERGEKHKIPNTGSTPLRRLKLYVSPAFDARENLRRGEAP